MGDIRKLLICVWTCSLVQAGPVEVENLNPTRGLIMEPLGKAVMYDRTWTIVTTITIPQWEPVFEYLKSCDQSLLEICSFRGEGAENRCKYWHNLILRDISDVEEQIQKLKSFMGQSRKRRGLVNLVGKVSKFLFGTMDSGDAENIYKRIEKLENNGAEDLELISKQMTLIKSNFESVLTPIKQIRAEQEEMKKLINQFTQEYADNISKLDQQTRRMRVQAESSEVMLAVVTHMQLTQKILTNLFTLITALQQHKLHPLLLPAATLGAVYSNLTSRALLSDHLKDPAILEQAVTVDHLLLPDRILVKIAIPLGKREEYVVNKIYRYPIPAGNHKFAILDIKAKFVITNSNTGKFRSLSEENFVQRCSNIQVPTKDVRYLCKDRDAIPMGTTVQDQCLTFLINGNMSSQPNCPALVLLQHPGLLKKMEAPNSWLFSYDTSQTLQTHCSNGTAQQLVKGTGILRLSPQCSFTLGSWSLPVENVEITQVKGESNNSSQLTIPHIHFNLDPIINITSKLFELKVTHDSTDLLDSAAQQTAELADKIHYVETRRLKENQERYFWITVGSTSGTTIFIFGIIVFLIIRVKYGHQNNTTKASQPPREIVISAPLPPPSQISRSSPKKVTICESNYERPPEEAPPTPPRNTQLGGRANSIRIPRFCIESLN